MGAVKTWDIGDVVRLKGGGPPLTVAETQTAPNAPVKCIWFDRDGILKVGQFPAMTVEEHPRDGR